MFGFQNKNTPEDKIAYNRFGKKYHTSYDITIHCEGKGFLVVTRNGNSFHDKNSKSLPYFLPGKAVSSIFFMGHSYIYLLSAVNEQKKNKMLNSSAQEEKKCE